MDGGNRWVGAIAGARADGSLSIDARAQGTFGRDKGQVNVVYKIRNEGSAKLGGKGSGEGERIMKIAWSRCESSCCVVIDRMMRCEAGWHYGLSGKNKAVRGGQSSGDLSWAGRVILEGERAKEKEKDEREKSIIWNGLHPLRSRSRCEDEMRLTAEANRPKRPFSASLLPGFVDRIEKNIESKK